MLYLFGEANSFIGVHGGAHINLVFAPIGGLKVLEMAPLNEAGAAGVGFPNSKCLQCVWY